jgi:3-keto-disaccharide hydrolase
MNRKSVVAVGVLFAGFSLSGLPSRAAEQSSGMVALTDGRDMSKFDQVGNASWRIAERSIAADRGNGFLVTKQSYDNFKFRAEFYNDEGTNSGVFIRCDDPRRPSAQSCYEINIFDGNPNQANATGAIVNVAKVERVPQTELKWNVIEIEAKGSQLNVSINGERTASVRDTKHARGPIALQYASGVIYWRKVEIQPLSSADIEADAEPIYANCQAGFAVIFPGQPIARDTRYTLASGMSFPAREFFVEKGGNRYSVISIDFASGPYSDVDLVRRELAELSKKGNISGQAFVELGLSRPGGQLNIIEPNGRQLRASVYMAQRRMIITQAEATMGDSEALQFEQSIALVNHAGTDLDRVANGNDPPRMYDCR